MYHLPTHLTNYSVTFADICYAFVLELISYFYIQLGKSLTYSHLPNMLHGCLLVHSRKLIIKNPRSTLGSQRDACCAQPEGLNCPTWCSYPKKQDEKEDKLGSDILAHWLCILGVTVLTLCYTILILLASY